jgi:hypothetical protein
MKEGNVSSKISFFQPIVRKIDNSFTSFCQKKKKKCLNNSTNPFVETQKKIFNSMIFADKKRKNVRPNFFLVFAAMTLLSFNLFYEEQIDKIMLTQMCVDH